MDATRQTNGNRLTTQEWLRLKLITAFDGDVVKATVALDFVNGHPETSEMYRHFVEWKKEQYREYCRARGIKIGKPTST